MQGTDTVPSARRPAAVSAYLRLNRTPNAVPFARHYIAATLTHLSLPDLADTAELITSELVTNALRYGQGDLQLLLDLAHGAVTLTVADQTPFAPLHVVHASPDAEHGRGLVLVEALASRWGSRPVDGTPAHGTAVWAEIGLVTA